MQTAAGALVELPKFFLLLAFVLGCGGAPEPTTAEPSYVLRVGTSGDYAPFSLLDPESAVRQGFDIEVAQLLAKDLGLRLQWVAFRWPELQEAVASDRFDIAMSGITWRPTRSVLGWMTQAVARGGPCLLGDPAAHKLAVNRGGALEAWAKRTLPERQLLSVTDNLNLPKLLKSGEVGAIVTDSFELGSFRGAQEAQPTEGRWTSHCEIPTWRKVYWIAPERQSHLAPEIERWLRDNEPVLQSLRQRWFGDAQDSSVYSRLVDLLARRLALMPHVATYKRDHGLPIEDLARESRILEGVELAAKKYELNQTSLRRLFQLQMTLAKAIQQRPSSAVSIDLKIRLRPTLIRLGARISEELAALAHRQVLAQLVVKDLELLTDWLQPKQLQELTVALRGPWSL